MKKLLTILSSFGLIATTGASVVACKNDQSNSLQPKEAENKELGNTGTNKGKDAEKAKLKSQITELQKLEKQAESILKRIEEGEEKAKQANEEEKKKIEKELETLKKQKPEVSKQLETAKITRQDLEAKLKALENNNS
ncbi:lipoprotein [Mycoplasma mycoides]|uniref:lipoprotein n=1 Tax=Mycoplasma mycoides TaxID=2102 RepID=UPI00223EFE01|nr:lipoprotein [Mycoplasma mycoides]QVK06461.1 lipoprotein [Mycoplasma mycoides subsp. capri]